MVYSHTINEIDVMIPNCCINIIFFRNGKGFFFLRILNNIRRSKCYTELFALYMRPVFGEKFSLRLKDDVFNQIGFKILRQLRDI